MQSMFSHVVIIITCGYIYHKWLHVVTFVTCWTCHMCSHLSHSSHVVTIVTSCHNCHILSHLSHVVTIVTCGHNCHMWSQLSLMVTIVTCILIAAIQISISPLSSFSSFSSPRGHYDLTAPSSPTVKMVFIPRVFRWKIGGGIQVLVQFFL